MTDVTSRRDHHMTLYKYNLLEKQAW